MPVLIVVLRLRDWAASTGRRRPPRGAPNGALVEGKADEVTTQDAASGRAFMGHFEAAPVSAAKLAPSGSLTPKKGPRSLLNACGLCDCPAVRCRAP